MLENHQIVKTTLRCVNPNTIGQKRLNTVLAKRFQKFAAVNGKIFYNAICTKNLFSLLCLTFTRKGTWQTSSSRQKNFFKFKFDRKTAKKLKSLEAPTIISKNLLFEQHGQVFASFD